MSIVEPLALIIASDVRIAVVQTLSSSPKGFAVIQESIARILGRAVSDGSLTWHLTKLEGAGITSRGSSWALTPKGVALASTLARARIFRKF